MKAFNIFVFSLTLILFACQSNPEQQQDDSHSHHQETKSYTCPMHPEIISDKPGSCPICGMDLVPVTKTDNPVLMLSEGQIKLANIKVQQVGAGNFKNKVELEGKLVTDANQVEIVSSRFKGRVDHLYLKEIGVPIHNGQALFSIYSEELSSLQNDYLLAIKQHEEFPNETIYKKLGESAVHKLKLFGFNEKQIGQLKSSGKTNPTITVYAKTSGIVKEINVFEGAYIDAGSPLFRVENSGSLWVEAAVFPYEIENIKTGTPVQISVSGYNDKPIFTQVDFISPQLNNNQQTITIRAKINNSDLKYQEGMLAKLTINKINEQDVLTIPTNAVIRDQHYQHVWIQTDQHTFEPRKVIIDKENEFVVTLKEGLKNGEKVVYSGAYLLYSEYKLKKGALNF
ncbi:efflux RND transporter periplasmic adaptor subunit [Pseudopedobacter beijingensis]|uniref:Efflux RND transporter periplasmic adaptor subunit n=1 Tax=Pseudopedobacter beijingensis TaxID=1207056 RepID=A0ABW4I6P8_9SPHI